MKDAVIVAIVFFALYHILKEFTVFRLKRRIIRNGHIGKAEILNSPEELKGEKRYSTLKWSIVAFLAGAGLIVIELLNLNVSEQWAKGYGSLLPIGIELVFISLGFLIYFIIVSVKMKKDSETDKQ